MKTLWIISELFYPNESATAYILTEMAKKFAGSYAVNVICADTNYENDDSRVSADDNKTLPGIEITRVRVPELDKNNIAKRLLRFITVSRQLYKVADKMVQPGDVVFAVTNPAFILTYMAKLKKQKNIEYFLLVHDVFPENAAATGVMKIQALYHRLKKRFDKAYSAADRIIVLGEDMKQVIASKIDRDDNIYVCENWGSNDIIPSERKSDGKIVLQYAGNIGRVQGIEKLVDLATQINNSDLVFDFWGSGALVPYLNKFIETNHLSNVRVRGSYSRGAKQNEVLNDCDIAIVGLAKGMKGLGVPSKTYNILAAEKPIIYIGDPGSEVYNLVKDNDLGAVFDWDHFDALTNWLNGLNISKVTELRQKGKRARALYEQCYTKEVILDKLMNVIK